MHHGRSLHPPPIIKIKKKKEKPGQRMTQKKGKQSSALKSLEIKKGKLSE